MSRHFVMSFRFLSPRFHGRGDEGVPEWPPSPLRAFQAVVAAAARARMLDGCRGALSWLERQPAPLIVAPATEGLAAGYRLSVPHNAMDLVGRQWTRGAQGNPAEHRTMKSVRPHRLPEGAAVHYAWPVEADLPGADALIASARQVVALGWGTDLVVGDAALVDDAALTRLRANAQVWLPRGDGRCMLRVPVDGTLAALATRHSAFLARTRLADPTLRPPPPLSAFDVAGYARADQPPLTEIAGFTLMKVAADTLRAFDPVTRGMAVAGMLRHLVRRAAERAGWDPARVNACVLGHGVHADGRLLLVPVPSIEPRGPGAQTVGPVRRVMLFSTAAGSRDTEWARRSLGGMGLVAEDTGEVQAVLAAAPRGDRVLARYLGESCCWATVTPLVLPGHDDRGGLRHRLQRAASTPQQEVLLARLSARREALVRKALSQSGLGDELAATAHIETRETGFLAGVRRASEFAVPSHLSEHPRLHVKLTWPRKVPGPLCLGRGRFSGVGLFAAAEG